MRFGRVKLELINVRRLVVIDQTLARDRLCLRNSCSRTTLDKHERLFLSVAKHSNVERRRRETSGSIKEFLGVIRG